MSVGLLLTDVADRARSQSTQRAADGQPETAEAPRRQRAALRPLQSVARPERDGALEELLHS